jgi:hypothetical protein
MRQKRILGSFVFVCGVWSLGCQPPELGVEGWVEAQRASAESVCGCASALGSSVGSCLEDFDATEYEDTTYQCVLEALAADPGTIDHVDCLAESYWKLDECASESTCDEDRLPRCIDQHEVRIARCPQPSPIALDAQERCLDRARIAEDPVDRYLAAVTELHDRSFAWSECVRASFEPNAIHTRDHAVCVVPPIDDYNDCIESGAPSEACQPLLAPMVSCPPLHPSLVDWLAHCDMQHP